MEKYSISTRASGFCRGSGILWVSYPNQRTRTGFVGGEATSSQGMAGMLECLTLLPFNSRD